MTTETVTNYECTIGGSNATAGTQADVQLHKQYPLGGSFLTLSVCLLREALGPLSGLVTNCLLRKTCFR